MIIESIELSNFRNYENLQIHLDEGTNILYGDNAQGKTNILEAAYLSGTTKSHKGSRDKEMIRFGENESHIRTVVKKNELVSWYDELINENKLLFTADLVKGMLDEAYKLTDTKQMSKLMGHIIGICYATNNSHFKWFGNLLKNHIKGIITHAELQLSSGKVEGTNRKIKTIRWQAYGFKDDEYFFLKIIDATRSA